MTSKYPPSLTATPNIPLHKQTLEQLIAERDYWQAKIEGATSWGAAVGAAAEFRDDCQLWIDRRQKEAGNG